MGSVTSQESTRSNAELSAGKAARKSRQRIRRIVRTTEQLLLACLRAGNREWSRGLLASMSEHYTSDPEAFARWAKYAGPAKDGV